MASPSYECYHNVEMIRAVFFDLYGTLAGFSPSRYEIQSTACAYLGLDVTSDGILKGYALADAYMAERNAVSPLRGLDQESRLQFFTEYEKLVLKGAGFEVNSETALRIWCRVRQIPYQLTCFDDVVTTMDLLKKQGLILGLISNMNRSGLELVQSLGLGYYLDFAVTSLDVGSEKPHPPIFWAALAKAGAKPMESMHVGDQLISDVEGARRMGIAPVLLDRDRNHRQVRYCPRIESLTELPGLLDGY